MNSELLLAFMRRTRYWVQASTHASGGPQVAVVGVAVGDGFELVFDTLSSTRKCANLRRDPRVALVMWAESDSGGEATVQLEGIADEPSGEEMARIKAVYFARFPDGPTRETWEGITYFRIRPRWIRYTDFGPNGMTTFELRESDLALSESTGGATGRATGSAL